MAGSRRASYNKSATHLGEDFDAYRRLPYVGIKKGLRLRGEKPKTLGETDM